MKDLKKFLVMSGVSLMALSMPVYAQAPAAGGSDSGDEAANPADIIVTARRTEERLQDVPISISVFSQEQLSNQNINTAMDIAKYTPSLSANGAFGNDNTTFAIRGFVQDIGTAPSVGTYFADVVAPRGGGVGIPFGDGASAGSFFDLQNVQVLKGPQGTLQGRNTTGGSVIFVPRKPTSELEGYVEGSIGNYAMRRVEAVLNVPLGDKFRMRLGVDRMTRDGYLINDSGIGPKDFNDTNYTAIRASFVADLTPNLENYTIVSYTNSDTNGSAQKVIAVGPGLGGNPALDLNPLNLAGYNQLALGHGKGFYHIDQDMDNPRSHTRQWQVINTTTWRASDNLTIKNIVSYAQFKHDINSPLFSTNLKTSGLGDYAALFYNSINAGQLGGVMPAYSVADAMFGITAFANSKNGIPVGMYSLSSAAGLHSADQSTFSEELQFQGRSSDDRLKWQAGVYFESSKPLSLVGQQTKIASNCTNLATFQCSDPYGSVMTYVMNVFNQYSLLGGGPAAFPAQTVGAANYTVARQSFRDVGLYGQVSYAISDKLTATGGFRYTWDRQSVDATMITNNYVTSSYTYGSFTAPLPQMWGFFDSTGFHATPLNGVVPTAEQTIAPRCTMPTTATGGLFSPYPGCSVKLSTNSSAPTWMVDLEYKPVEDIMLYAKYSRGYRAGGIKHDAPVAMVFFKPEKVDTFEAGLKSSFRGQISGVFNATAYYNKFSNQQLLVGLNARPGSGLAPTGAPYNAGKSRMWGIEVDSTLNLFRGFSVSFGYAYLNTRIEAISLPSAAVAAPYIVSPNLKAGDQIALAPKNKFTVSANYDLPLPASIGKISLGGTFTHTDSMISNYADRRITVGGVYVDGPTGPVISHADIGILQPTDLLDLNVNWNGVAGSPVDLSFFMTNVTGQHYLTYTPGLLQGNSLDPSGNTGSGIETANVGAPRMFGMRAKVRF